VAARNAEAAYSLVQQVAIFHSNDFYSQRHDNVATVIPSSAAQA